MIEHDPAVLEYEHEKFRPREAEALQTLRKVASLVKPVMRQRGWTVGTLAEFWPPENNLLGVNWNKGQKICLRLRYPYDERQFIPLEEVVDTMLHELCHIIHGPHDEAFHNLWNQLRSEQESLIRKGYTGEGFLSTGHKLGGGRIPMHEARRRARAAAEKRRTLTTGSGQKLGGAVVRRGEDIRKVIADAATRRITVTKGCASGTDRSRRLFEETTKNGFRTKAEEEDADEEAIMQAYIEMIQEEEREKYGKNYVPPSKSNPGGSQGMAITIDSDSESEPERGTGPSEPPELAETSSDSAPPISVDTNPPLGIGTPSLDTVGAWSCEICTLSNPATYLCCDACSTERTFSTPFSTSQNPPPQERSQTTAHHTPRPPGDHPGKSSKSIKALSSLSTVESKKSLGWVCHRCGRETEMSYRGLCVLQTPEDWERYKKRGSARVARLDKKSLLPEHVEVIADFCETKMLDSISPAVEAADRYTVEEIFEEHATKEMLELYWETYRSRLAIYHENWRSLPSPYLMSEELPI